VAETRRKTVMVIGAAAGVEYGFPLGTGLRSDIAERTSMVWKDGAFAGGDGRLSDAIEMAWEIAKRTSAEEERKFYRLATKAISEGLTAGTVSSIDSFIYARQKDKRIAHVAKLAIARAILDYEHRSQLLLSQTPDTLNLKFASTTWLAALGQLLFDCQPEELEARLATFTLVVFNYDRVIEHFLHRVLQVHHGVSTDNASQILKSLKIFHPYGQVGSLPWQGGGLPVPFGVDAEAETLLRVADGLRTYTEGTDPGESEIEVIRERLRECERLAFLGFGYLPINMKLLSYPTALGKLQRSCYGTAVLVSEHNRGVFKADIERHLPAGYRKNLELTGHTCAELLRAYWEPLSRP